MFNRAYSAAVLLAALASLPAAPAHAQGEILITQAKANAGNVTPGDLAGFPVRLSQPGSYKLADNLTPGANLNGIVVAAPDVTIDLNGFRMSGGPAGGANNSPYGIVAQGDRLTVKNGTLGAFKIAGIYAANRHFLIVENARIIHGGTGINASFGNFARIQNSTVAVNSGTGVVCNASCHIEGSVVSGNGDYGIVIDTGTVLDNTILSNTKEGLNSQNVIGFGNNTLVGNNGGGFQVTGSLYGLHPNVCRPLAC